MYDYRARWYLPDAGVFGERDPVGYAQSPNLYGHMEEDPANLLDPMGRQFGPYGGFNSETENKELWRKYQTGQVTRVLEDFLGDVLGTVVAIQRGNFTNVVDLGAKQEFGVDPDDNRRSWGLTRRLAAGMDVVKHADWGGAVIGDNLQIFSRGRAGYVAAIYTFDTFHAWLLRDWHKSPNLPAPLDDVPVYGKMGFRGAELSAGLAFDYAVNIWKEKNNTEQTETELVRSWGGYFHEASLSASIPEVPIGPGVSGFLSDRWLGASMGLGVGVGASLANTYFVQKIGPVHVSSVVGLAHVAAVYWQGGHLLPWVREEFKKRLNK